MNRGIQGTTSQDIESSLCLCKRHNIRDRIFSKISYAEICYSYLIISFFHLLISNFQYVIGASAFEFA